MEWLSYTFRYIPLGLLDVVPQRLNWRPPSYYGRDDLETLMASDSAADWVWSLTPILTFCRLFAVHAIFGFVESADSDI